MMLFMFLFQFFHRKKKPFVNRILECNLTDEAVDQFIDEVSLDLVEETPEEIVHQAGLKLAKYGTPNSCLLAIYIANYSDTTYPESTVEVFRNATCEFKPVKDTSPMARTIEIIRGKFLHSEN